MSYRCHVLADSISPAGVRLTTLELCYPRVIHSEIMTHRVFSRNARSSRAVPIAVMIDEVLTDPAVPARWSRNEAGMVGKRDIDNPDQAEKWWRKAMLEAVGRAQLLRDLGCHKQIVNRLLEPFGWIWTVVSSTAWDNFLTLRCALDVDPTLLPIAVRIGRALWDSTPAEVGIGAWHLPYCTEAERAEIPGPDLAQVSAARCGRVSYRPFDAATSDIAADLARADRLVASGHWSPFEHQATPSAEARLQSGNFCGWWQNRQFLDEESRERRFDYRVLDRFPTDGVFGD